MARLPKTGNNPCMALHRAQFLPVSIQAVAALYLSTSPAVKLSYSGLRIDTKSNSVCFPHDKGSSEVALLSTCDVAAMAPSSALPQRELCDAKISVCTAQGLFWAGCKAVSLCFLSVQTSAKHSTSKWGVWSKEKNTTMPGKAQETALSKAISGHMEVPQVAA